MLSRYRFTKNSAPELMDWSYRRGYSWGTTYQTMRFWPLYLIL